MAICVVCRQPGRPTTRALSGLPLGTVVCLRCRLAVKRKEVGIGHLDGNLHITDGRDHPLYQRDTVMHYTAIKGFSGPVRFLSNFYIEPDGSHVEGEYQRAKCAEYQDRSAFDGKTPSQCKAIGKRVLIRPDWEDVKLGIMEFYVTKKFKDHPSLRDALLATGNVYLEETNLWGDRYWGVCQGRGQNMLGAILMQVRDRYR